MYLTDAHQHEAHSSERQMTDGYLLRLWGCMRCCHGLTGLEVPEKMRNRLGGVGSFGPL
jgi:hypothetical protein